MDAVIPFGPLGPEARLWIVRDRIEQFQRSLPDPRAEIRIDKRLLAALAEPNGIDGGVAQSLRQRAEETVLKPIRAYLAEHASDETRELSVTAREGKIDIQSG
jgi:ATP-dependent Clp protease ATP-binding subunit ClpA